MKLVDQSGDVAIEEMSTRKRKVVKKQKVVKPPHARSISLILTVLAASVVSVSTTVYYLNTGEILLYNDAYSHLRIARSVIDSLTPGIDRLSDVWLPLQHVLILPFVWNDWLWQTGLAGAIPSMISYVVAAGYLFCILRRLTKQIPVSLLGVIIFLCNPNILYLQSTPLTEVMCAAAFAATAYYLLRWLQDDRFRYLIYTAIAVCISTLIRYDGWALLLVVSTLILASGLFRKQNREITIDRIMAYLSIVPLGIIFWFAWNKHISDDPLYFQHGLYSSQAQQLYFLKRGHLPAYHNMLTSLRIYTIDVGQTVGWGLFICALLSLALILVVRRKQQEYFLLAIMLTPFVFYVITLYLGQSVIELPAAGNEVLFNVRYGAQMALPVAFLIARGSAVFYSLMRQWYVKVGFIVACLACVSVQVIGVNASGVLSLQDGLTGRSCINIAEPVIISLSQHYNGGRILVDEYNSEINPQLFGAHFSDIIYEESGSYLQGALAHPEKFVDWVVFNPYTPGDVVAKVFTRDTTKFLALFKKVSSDPDGLQLYYRIGAPSLPTRPVPDALLKIPHTCKLKSE